MTTDSAAGGEPSPTIPYTHWAYFDDADAASSCAAELGGQDFLTGVEPSESYRGRLLLRAAREVPVGGMVARHEHVEAIVERHGGTYDGGESGWLDLSHKG